MWKVYSIHEKGPDVILVDPDGGEASVTVDDDWYYTVEDRENGLVLSKDGVVPAGHQLRTITMMDVALRACAALLKVT